MAAHVSHLLTIWLLCSICLAECDPNTFTLGLIRVRQKPATNFGMIDAIVAESLKKISHLVSYSNTTVTAVFGHRKIIIKNIYLPLSCDASSLLNAVLDTRSAVDGYIQGEGYESCPNDRKISLTCNMLQMLCNKWRKPCVSWNCNYPLNEEDPKGDKIPQFYTVVPHAQTISKGVLSVLDRYRWKNVAYFYSLTPSPYGSICGALQQAMFNSKNVTMQYSKALTEIYKSKNGSRFKPLAQGTLDRITGEIIGKSIKAFIFCLPHTTKYEVMHRSNLTFEKWKSSQKHFSIFDQILAALYDKYFESTMKQAFIVVDPMGRYYKPFVGSKRQKRSNKLSKSRLHDPIPDVRNNIRKSINEAKNFPNEHVIVPTAQYSKRRSVSDDMSGMDAPTWASNETTVAYPVKNFNPYENTMILSPYLEQVYYNTLQQHLSNKEYFPSKKTQVRTSPSQLAYFNDALALMAETWISWTHTTPAEQRTMRNLSKEIRQSYIRNGATGNIHFDAATGMRDITFILWDVIVKPIEASYNVTSRRSVVPIFKLTSDVGENVYQFSLVNREQFSNMEWHKYGVPPPDKQCDVNDIMCKMQTTNLRVLDFVIVLMCLTGLAGGGYLVMKYKKNRKEAKEVTRGPNKLFLTKQDLKFRGSTERGAGNALEVNDPSGSVAGSIGTLDDIISANTNANSQIASLQGEIVFIKSLPKTPQKKKKVKSALKSIRDLRHENLCRFYGLCIEKEKGGLVMEYCSRKSLRDIILLGDITLDATFKMSLIKDLVKGMKYIHGTSIRYHGRLKSTNCLVDCRFALKITDYGVNKIKTICNMEHSEKNEDLLWTAPEHLPVPAEPKADPRPRGSQKGDAYSFAIILQEILLEQGPFERSGLSADDIIHKIKTTPPLFSTINTEIKRLNRGNKNSILETMMAKLETHNSELEHIVVERTRELVEEKKKTENLLNQMLPKAAADMLKLNKEVVPETFDKVTIYFSDICGFTTISHASTPLQVVEFLNDLYSCFDKVIANYDVYKVETIGDAYMVSSGVPNRIGDRHASEIALMSLDLLSATCSFRVRHFPGIKLRIRIGLHSGHCVGGVVGVTMPRYCLFGDTINTAARMESTGIPSRVHLSPTTKDLLVKSNMGFKIEKRGNVELKGRGEMTTWWLTGKEGWSKELPTPGDVNAPNHGIDPSELIVKSPANLKQGGMGGMNSNINNNLFPVQSYTEKTIKKLINTRKFKCFGGKKHNEVRPLV